MISSTVEKSPVRRPGLPQQAVVSIIHNTTGIITCNAEYKNT